MNEEERRPLEPGMVLAGLSLVAAWSVFVGFVLGRWFTHWLG